MIADPRLDEPSPARPGRTFWSVGLVLSSCWLAILGSTVLVASLLPLPDPNRTNVQGRLQPIGTQGHILGTDGLGRDILARLIYGARVSVAVAVIAVATGLIIGTSIGLVVGVGRRWLDQVVGVILNAWLAFPGLVLLLAVLSHVGRGMWTIALVIGVLSAPTYARLARVNAMSVAAQDFVLASRMSGARLGRILRKEILPNVSHALLAYAFTAVAVVVVLEGSLSFLGLSVPPPTATWGTIIADGKPHLSAGGAHVSLVPATAMFLTVLSVNLIGDAFRGRTMIDRLA